MKRYSRLGVHNYVAAGKWSAAILLAISLSASAQVGPELKIQTSGTNRVRLRWTPDQNLNVLEAAPSLDGIPNWREVGPAPEIVGPNLQVEPSPAAGSRFFRLSSRGQIGTNGNPGTLADPSRTASPPPPNALEDFASSTSFLYSGSNAVQLGLGPGIITAKQASVLRGRVLKRNGSPLNGVRVAILNHPEFGYTFSRASGMFDLAVNGGPLYTLDYQAIGYCPAQRQVQAPVQDFRCVEDVILVGMDPVATPVAFGTASPIQSAHSTTNVDSAGARSATLLFPPGTCATLEMPDGSTQSCQGLTIRATEFTVGPDGPKAMPGPLPAASAYTYAVELSGDEAVSAGARTIRFNQIIHVYVDNFLGMPVGALVPNGYYDRQLSSWVPQENGVVIKVLDTNGGVAQVDIDGNGEPENAGVLANAAFTTDELHYLAANYPAGKTLWRMPTSHFTALDFNCPQNPADKGKPNKPGDQPNGDPNDNNGGYGSVNVESQVFQETIPLVGTSMDLHYSSARVPGYRVNADLRLPLTGDSIFPGLTKVRVDMDIAGRLSEFEYPPDANQVEDFGWDGYDAYGRLVNETRTARFGLFYYYPQVYGGHAGLAANGITTIGYGPPLFGNYGQFTSTIGHVGISQAIAINFERKLTIPDHRKLGLGGWSLTPLHRYDPYGRILYKGDGTIERPDSLVNGVSVVEFNDPAQAWIKVAAASDGSLFLVAGNAQIFRMTSSGLLTSVSSAHPFVNPEAQVVGYGDFTQADGKPASKIWFNQIPWQDIAVGPDDSLYLRTFWSIIRITPDGILRVVLGPYGSNTMPPNGSLARAGGSSSSDRPGKIAIGPDQTVYYSDEWTINNTTHYYLRKISPDGRISTVMGDAGPSGGIFDTYYFTTSVPAAAAKTTLINGLAVGPDGSVYVAGDYQIVRITPGGLVQHVTYSLPFTYAGFPGLGELSEGTSAVNAPNTFPSQGNWYAYLRVAPNNEIYFARLGNPQFIWKIDNGGFFQRVAGNWSGTFDPGVNPREASVGDLYDMTIDRNGALTMLSRLGFGTGPFALRRIGPAFPGFDATELSVASRDGGELYVFNAAGMHLRTINTLTGVTNWLFTYDSSNLVTQIRDVNGLATSIQRAADGQPEFIVGPYGQKTAVALDTNGYLATVTDPSGGAATLGYGTAGLLTSIRGPRGNTFSVAYDSKGRADLLNDPTGGFRQIHRIDSGGTDFSTVIDTSTGDHSVRSLSLASNGDSRIVRTNADGTVVTEVRPVLGGSIVTNADGTVFTIKETGNPRFPGQSRVIQSIAIAFPGGLNSSVTINRSAVLNDPGNLLTLASLTTSLSLNGQVYSNQFDAVSKRFTDTSPSGRVQTTLIDAAGHIVGRQLGADAPVTNAYDSFGRLAEIRSGSSTQLRTNRIEYHTNGLLSQLTDPLGRTVKIVYDAANHPAQVTLPDGGLVSFEVDAENHLAGVTPPGRPKHQFEYNTLGLLTRYTPPTVTADNSMRFGYDLDRNLTNVALPDGQTFAMSRGPGGRPNQWKLGSGPAIDFSYSAVTGQLTNMLDSTGQGISFGYQGSLPTLARWSGSVTGTVALQFDPNLAIASQTINGTSDAYSHDSDGLIMQAGDLVISRDAASGRVVTNRMGTVSESYAYNEMGLLTNQSVSATQAVLYSVQLQYDGLNRITNKVETVSGVSHAYGYTYDIGGRLSMVRRDGAMASIYTYDTNGNRLTHNGETANYDAQDRLTSYAGTTFGWSPNGHRTSQTSGSETTAYSYDVRGVLSSVTLPNQQVDYILDPLGRRIGKKVNGVMERGWLWTGNQVVAEVGANSAVTKRFIYGANSITPATMVTGTNSYRIISDERGSVRLVVSVVDGTVAQSVEYDEFGRIIADSNPGFQPFGYVGGLYDPDTGLTRFGFRDFDPATGQWTCRDPIGFMGGQTSLYAYTSNDPLNFIDPLGTGPWATTAYRVGKGALGVIGGILAITAAGTIAAVGTVPALTVAALVGTAGAIQTYNSTYNSVNAIINPSSSDIPTTLGAGIALSAGNSADAQRAGAILDLAIAGATGRAAGYVLNGGSALSGAANYAATASDGLGVVDSTASAYGLTPGSERPALPSGPPTYHIGDPRRQY